MRTTFPFLLLAALSTPGCSRIANSSFNPMNWFGSTASPSASQASAEIGPLVPERTVSFDQRGGIAEVSALRFNRTPDGGILQATGIASTQGQFNAQLVPVSIQNGTLTLAFKVESSTSTASGRANTRQITVARVFSNADLIGIRSIVVQGARNSRSVRL